jgi:peptide/nickel transport system substrate-binding protein
LFGATADQPANIEWPRPSRYATDIAKAKQLLSEAGYPDGFDTTLSFDLGSAGINEPMCVLIQESLKSIGIRCTIEKITGSNWRSAMLKREMPLFLDQYVAWLDYPEYFFVYNYYSKDALFNVSDYQSSEMDRLIDGAKISAATGNKAEYERDVRGFTELALHDLPRVPLYQPTTNVAMQKSVTGYAYWSHRRLDYRAMKKS